MGVKIQSGNQGSGSGMGGLMDIFKMFGGGGGGGGSAQGQDPSGPTMQSPTSTWAPQQLQQPQLGSQYGGAAQQYGANDSFMSNLDAMGRRKSQISSGQGNSGSGGISSVASIASLI